MEIVLLVVFIGLAVSRCGDDQSETKIEFTTSLIVSPDTVFVGCLNAAECQVTVRITLDRPAAKVFLQRMSSADGGTVLGQVGELVDDGDAAGHGDDIAGDLVYSTIITLNEVSAGYVYLQAVVGDAESSVSSVGVLAHMTDEDWTKVTQTIPDLAKACYDTNPDLNVAKTCIETIDGIRVAGIGEQGSGIWYVYDNGILGGVLPTEIDAPDADSGTDMNRKGGRATSSSRANAYQAPADNRWGQLVAALDEFKDPDAIGSKSAIYLGPYLWDFGAADDYSGAWDLIKKSVCPKFETQEIKNDTNLSRNVTPDSFKNLSNHGIIIISTHGDNWYNGLFSLWNDLWGDQAGTAPNYTIPFFADLSWPVLLTGYKTTDDIGRIYEADLLQHRIAITASRTYVITPAFVRRYNSTFPESIVYLGSCRSAYNSTLADAFLEKGAAAVVGYSDYVYAGWAKRHGEALFGPDPRNFAKNSMLPLTDPDNEKTTVQSIKDAFDDAVANYGEVTNSTAPHGAGDGTNGAYDAADPEPARIVLFPAATKTNLNVPPIINGGFEKGSTAGWTSTGDYRVLSAIGDVTPTDGTFMAIISTGLGTYGGGLTESVVQQTMCLPAKVKSVRFQYNMLTEEAMCWVGSAYDDTFKAELVDKDGVILSEGASESVNSSAWTFLGGDMFADGDDFSTPQKCTDDQGNESYGDGTYHTGWKDGELDVSSHAGTKEPVTLRFRIWDEGDSIWDSAATLDSVELELEEE